MIESFFPKPKLFFLTTSVWVLLSILFWVYLGDNLGKLIISVGFIIEKFLIKRNL